MSQIQYISGPIGFQNTDLAKIFVFNRRTSSGTFKTEVNNTYNDGYIPAGTVLGRATSGPDAGLIKPFTSTATDGSQYVVGILLDNFFLPAGQTVTGQTVWFCVEGDVASNLVQFNNGTDTLQTVCANGRTCEDKIGAEAVAIKLVRTEIMTDFNNSGH